ncbi:hypothetical protein [Nocardia sp. NPDC051570]|uniref:hypothetical protein n=1 Tax=Nocardia sp. NPDC051570 TaxID=3364324 RepID=UPI003788372E
MYFSVDGSEFKRIAWKTDTSIELPSAGKHELSFEVRYFDRLTCGHATLSTEIQPGDPFVVVNGWTNQHPFAISKNRDS